MWIESVRPRVAFGATSAPRLGRRAGSGGKRWVSTKVVREPSKAAKCFPDWRSDFHTAVSACRRRVGQQLPFCRFACPGRVIHDRVGVAVGGGGLVGGRAPDRRCCYGRGDRATALRSALRQIARRAARTLRAGLIRVRLARSDRTKVPSSLAWMRSVCARMVAKYTSSPATPHRYPPAPAVVGASGSDPVCRMSFSAELVVPVRNSRPPATSPHR